MNNVDEYFVDSFDPDDQKILEIQKALSFPLNKWIWHVFGEDTLAIKVPFDFKWYQRLSLKFLLGSYFVKL